MKEIPLLTAQDIDVRVQSVSRTSKGKVVAQLLLYKNARTDMRILDHVFGPLGWQRSHEVIDGKLFCNIDVWDENKGQWVRKQDVGTENNMEKTKSEASDSFKRAGTNVGIGRELYTAPAIFVELQESEFKSDNQRGKETFKVWPSVKFRVKSIEYNDRREITSLVVEDRHGRTRFEAGKPTGQAPAQSGNQAAMQCSSCGASVTEAEARYSTQNFGRVLCRACQRG